MVEGIYQIAWTKRAQQHMKQAYLYISNDSHQNAVKILEDIAAAVGKAVTNPEFYGPDKYKRNNDGSYRAFERHHYRIAYRFTKSDIRVLSVRHTSREPKLY